MPLIGPLLVAFGAWLKTTPLADLAVWLATTPPSAMINQSSWMTSTIQSIHIMAIAATFGAALMINLRILRLAGRTHTMAEIERRYEPWVWWGLLVLLVTGVLLVIAEPARELLNPCFWTKMFLIAAVALANLWFQRSVRRDVDLWDDANAGRPAIHVGAAVMILVWCVIMILGRWIAYFGI